VVLRTPERGWQRAVSHLLPLALTLLMSPSVLAEEATASVETVGRGLSSSIAVDAKGDLHLAYLTPNAGIYYAFRPAGGKKWFSISVIDSAHSTQNIYPMVTVDAVGQPHICVAARELKYVTLRDGKWVTQVIDPGSGTLSYHCSIAVSADGNPHLSWYHEFLPGGKQFSHLRHAEMEEGVWVVRSVDGGISGKWNSMALDAQGSPRIAYSQFARGGDLRFAAWNGKAWDISDIDSSRNSPIARGFDNSLVIGADGSEHISYFDDNNLKYAHRSNGKWVIETAATAAAGYDHYAGSTNMLLDKGGNPHIVYGDLGGVRHAFRRDDEWQTETVVSGGMQQYANVGAAIGADDKLYVSYPDPLDGKVKVATVQLGEVSANTPPKKPSE
jgi:hypothetical protein